MERARLINRLNDVMEEMSAGKNVVVVINGSPGMGKSTLLRDFSERAADEGAMVVGGIALRGEQKIPYSVLGKLLDSMGPALPPTLRSDLESATTRQSFIHVARVTFQAVNRLTEFGPVMVAVDDVQFIDIESLRCLQYLEQGLRGRPFGIVFTWEQQLDQEPLAMLEDFVYRSDVRRVQIDSLSPGGVAEMIAEHAGTTMDEHEATDLARVYHQVSGGNPMLVSAMLAEAPNGPYPVGDDPAGPRFREAIRMCVRRLGPLAVRVADGIAVLRDSSNMLVLSRLIDMHITVTRRVVGKLTAAGVLDGNGFRHEAVRTVILENIPADEAVKLRYRAAQLLHEEGVPSSVVADQLLEVDPFPQDWVLPILRSAAESALAGNDTRRAVEYLRFAAECCADQRQRYSLKTQVAALYWLIEPASSGSRLLSLKAPALTGMITGDDKVRVAELLLWNLRFDDALEVIDRIDGPARRFVRLVLSTGYPGLLQHADLSAVDELPAPATYSPALQAAESLATVLAQNADEHTIAQAEQVLQNAGRGPDAVRVVEPAILALIYSDLLDTAANWCERFAAELGGSGEPVWASLISGLNALVALRTGQLGAAVKHGETALALMADHSWSANAVLVLATLAEAHTSAGDHDAAARLFARPILPELLQTRAGLHYLYARGRHHLAGGRTPAALADFMACGERMTAWNLDSAALAPWRVGAADAWMASGDRDRAGEFITGQLDLLNPDLFRARGMTMRRMAVLQTADERLATLQGALQMLQIGNDRYESAHVLADMSEIYQQLGDKAYARTVARRAQRIAKSCNAEELCQKLLTAYVPGTKQQRRRTPKDDYFATLSDSERRVASLAALGYSNREIAEKLYVTVSTVEQHLTRVYRKLSIRNREELPMHVEAGTAEIA
ncbi:AAA family ATPase [Streptosporangium sp. DT93]|uniref:AAA family ATPase n=1 Tax=Streptosporangium sp. DT93 TaxID=3393428 RepID=UPI003CEC94F9